MRSFIAAAVFLAVATLAVAHPPDPQWRKCMAPQVCIDPPEPCTNTCIVHQGDQCVNVTVPQPLCPSPTCPSPTCPPQTVTFPVRDFHGHCKIKKKMQMCRGRFWLPLAAPVPGPLARDED